MEKTGVEVEGISSDLLLGEPLANYPSDRLPGLIVAVVVMGITGLAVTFGLGSQPYDWAPLLAMIIMGVVTGLVAWYVLHRWNREIILFQHGFTYREGSHTVEFFYAEIDSIRLRAEQRAYFGGLMRRNLYQFTVFTKQGETFTITNLYRRTAELGTRLQERVNQHLRVNLSRRLMQGEPLRFSDTLRLSLNGLHESGRDLPWDRFGGYRVHNRALTILDRDQQNWFSLPLWEYDNITILVELLREKLPINLIPPTAAQE